MKSSPPKIKLIILTSLAIGAFLLFPHPVSADTGDPKKCSDWNEWYGISGTQNTLGEFTGPVTLYMGSNCQRVVVMTILVDGQPGISTERNGNDNIYYTTDSEGPHSISFFFDTGGGGQFYGPFGIKISIYQPPSISGSLACSQWGENGWCVGSETLELSASDPQGKTVMISGDVAGTAFACPSGNTTCSISLPNGGGAINYLVSSETTQTASGTTSWSLDSSLPQISGGLSGSSGTNNWFISNVLLSASASDATSGLASLEYSNDNLTWTPYTSPLTLSDGIYNISLRAKDNAGNLNSVTQSIKIDSVTPNLNLALAGTVGLNGWYKSNVQWTASGNDSGSGLVNIEYSLDGGAWAIYNGALTLSDGAHSLSVRATDAAGNVAQAAQPVNVDTITPLINLSVNGTAGAGGFYISDIKVSTSASDAGAGLASLEYSLDNGAWTPYTSALPYSEGQAGLKFRAIDNAGNSTTTPTQILSIDKTPPVIDMSSAWNLGSTESYKITDGGSGVAGARVVIQDQHERYPKVAWDDGETGPTFAGEIFWDGRFADGTIAPAGDYFVTLKAYDRAGNESMKTGVITVENSLLTYLIPPSTRQSSNPAPLLNTIQPSITTEFGGDGNDESSDTQTNTTDVGGVLASSTGIEGTTSPALTTAGRVEVFSADTSASNTQPLSSSQTNGILWGGLAAAAIGAFTADAVRKKEEEAEAARKWWAEQVAMNKQMSSGGGDDDGGGMTYKQIGQAYQAALKNFKAQLQNDGLSPTQASVLQSQAIKNGSISSVTSAAQEAVNEKQKERQNQLNKLIAKNSDDAPLDMNKVNQLVVEANAQKAQAADSSDNLSDTRASAASPKSWFEEHLVDPLKRILSPKTVTGMILTAALTIPAVQWVNNIVTKPDIFLPIQARTEQLIEDFEAKHPPALENKTFSYAIQHPYEVFSTGADVLSVFTDIGASYADAVWQQNPIVQNEVKSLEALENSICAGGSNRCTAAFYLPAGLIANPFDTGLGVVNGFVVDPAVGVLKQAGLIVEAGERVYSAYQQGGLKAALETSKAVYLQDLNILLNDRQLQSVVFLEVLAVLALVAAPVAAGLVLGMTAKGLIDIDAAVTAATSKKSLVDLVTSHNVRTTVVSSALILGLVTVGFGQKVSEFRAFQDGLPPPAQEAFGRLSLLEQTRLAETASRMRIAPEAMDFYLSESARPGSPLPNLPLEDALSVSSLVEQTGRGEFILDFVSRNGVTDSLKLASPKVIKGMVNDSILIQTQEILNQNAGYNVSPESWFADYDTIGPRGTYITNQSAIRGVIGEFEGGGTIKVSAAEAVRLAEALGLEPTRFVDGFRISRVIGIKDMDLSYPIEGNDYFLGPGKGLPGGGAELSIEPSLPTDSPYIVEQIIVEVTP